MADGRDLQKSVGSGDGSWVARAGASGHAGASDGEGKPVLPARLASFIPTVFLYDNYPGGIGLSEPLWRRQAELITRAIDLVASCDCRAGCPACVGPVLASDEANEGATPKRLAQKVLVGFTAP
jgi:DEAD/DEAH box helicase domain-containing protein